MDSRPVQWSAPGPWPEGSKVAFPLPEGEILCYGCIVYELCGVKTLEEARDRATTYPQFRPALDNLIEHGMPDAFDPMSYFNDVD